MIWLTRTKNEMNSGIERKRRKLTGTGCKRGGWKGREASRIKGFSDGDEKIGRNGGIIDYMLVDQSLMFQLHPLRRSKWASDPSKYAMHAWCRIQPSTRSISWNRKITRFSQKVPWKNHSGRQRKAKHRNPISLPSPVHHSSEKGKKIEPQKGMWQDAPIPSTPCLLHI